MANIPEPDFNLYNTWLVVIYSGSPYKNEYSICAGPYKDKSVANATSVEMNLKSKETLYKVMSIINYCYECQNV